MSNEAGIPNETKDSGEFSDRQPELQALPLTGITISTIGTVVWLVIWVALSIADRDGSLSAHGHSTWTSIARAGVILGLISQAYTRRRAKRFGLR